MPAIGESLRHFIAQTEEAGSKASPAEGLPVAVTTARRYVMAMMSYAASGPSFCQRPRAEVLGLVDGGTIRICSDCVADCVAVIGPEHPEWACRRSSSTHNSKSSG